MGPIDLKRLQVALNVPADGDFGPTSCGALFYKCGAPLETAAELGLAGARWFPDYGILDSVERLAHFLAQVGHESGGFHYVEEIWGPTEAQKRYEGRGDLGNTKPGDGYRYKGRGPIQLTGRTNYRLFGRRIGIDLERHPEIAAIPSIGLHLALEFWASRNLNGLADADDIQGITKRINGGLTGLTDRQARLAKIKAWLT